MATRRKPKHKVIVTKFGEFWEVSKGFPDDMPESPTEVARSWTFDVWPTKYHLLADQSEFHFKIHVYKDLEMFRRAYVLFRPTGNIEEMLVAKAVTCPRTVYTIPPKESKDPDTRHPLIGHVLFAADELSGEIVCHEAVHMGACFCRAMSRLRLNDEQIDEGEEYLAYAISSCARQIVDTVWAFGIYKPPREPIVIQEDEVL
jgi:hypothetical protein